MTRSMLKLVLLVSVAISVAIIAACQPIQPDLVSTAARTAMQAETEAQNLAVVERFYTEFAAGNAAVISEVHPMTLTMHYAGSAEDVPTALLEEDLAAIKAANPDLHAEVHSMIAAGEYVFTELTWSGTHTGDFFGIAATGNPVVHNGIVVRRLQEGKIVESWEIWDDLTFLAELGLAPSWDEATAPQP